MEVKKAIKKVIALGAGATMVGATIMGAVAADLADYPAPFVQDGKFDGFIVVGDQAAASDVIGAVDIASSLQYAAKTTKTLNVGTGAGGVNVEGDAIPFSQANDMLEIRERLGLVRETFTEFDLDGLKGGIISTDKGTTDYNQYLRFEDSLTSSSVDFIQSGEVVFEENEEDEVGDFLKFRDGDFVFEYELEFEEGVETDVEFKSGTSGPLKLDDLEDEEFIIMGQTFSVVDTTVDTQRDQLTLELLGGDVTDTLEEGESRTYTVDGKDYEVELIIVADTAKSNDGTAKFKVNGEVTDELEDGETQVLSDFTLIGVREILPNEAGDVTGDLVEFFLGANKIEWQDRNYTDSSFDAGGVEISEENIEDGQVRIKASETSDTVLKISDIKYRLKADSARGDVYVPPGHGVKEFLDEPEGLLNPEWDVLYEGLMDTGVSIIRFDVEGDDAYKLKFQNREGLDYAVPFVDNSRRDNDFFKYGDEDDDFIFVEGFVNTSGLNCTSSNGVPSGTAGTGCLGSHEFPIDTDDYFLLTDSPQDETSFSHVLSYESVDTSNRELTFTDLATGTREITYEAGNTLGVLGSGDLVVGGTTYKVFISNNSAAGNPIAVDANADGVVQETQINVTVNGGGLLSLGNISLVQSQAGLVSGERNSSYRISENSITVQLTTLPSEFDGNGVLQTGAGESVNISIIQRSSNEVDLDVPSNQRLINLAAGSSTINITLLRMESLSAEDLKQGISTYGVFFEVTDNDNNNADELVIEYPLTQRGANVYVTTGPVNVVRSEAAEAGTVTTTEVTRINVGAAKLASEIAGEEMDHNMIVVGGPCANAAAAVVMGNPENCAEGFEEGKAWLKLYENNGNVAMLVAGYSADDTRRAAKVIANFEDYALSGSEVEVTGTSLSDISVSAVQSK